MNLIYSDNLLVDNIGIPVEPPKSLMISECQEKINFKLSSRCSHTLSIPCSSAFSYLGKSSSLKCVESVIKILDCKHEFEFKCFEYDKYFLNPSSFSCKSETRKHCWNFDKCSQFKVDPCGNNLKKQFCCDSIQKWRCNLEKHSYDLKLCSDGVPSECPGCSIANIDDQISRLNDLIEDPSIESSPIYSKTLPKELFNFESSAHIFENDLNFLGRNVNLFKKFKSKKTESIWSSQLFAPLEITCFLVLSKAIQNQMNASNILILICSWRLSTRFMACIYSIGQKLD